MHYVTEQYEQAVTKPRKNTKMNITNLTQSYKKISTGKHTHTHTHTQANQSRQQCNTQFCYSSGQATQHEERNMTSLL